MLEVRDISVAYGSDQVLRSVTVELSAGKILGLLGPNGAGKTTLIRALNGTVPLTRGEVRLNDRPLSGYSRREIAKHIAVVAQENETKFPVTVLDFVLAGRFARGSAFGWETDKDIAAARDALRRCDLADLGDRLMNELSGGERQRVVLARALATEAEMLLLDEPTANLDLEHQALMFRIVRERCDAGSSAVVITHDLNLAAAFADAVLMLKNGRVCAFGPLAEVLNEQVLNDVYNVQVLLDENPASGKVRVTTVY